MKRSNRTTKRQIGFWCNNFARTAKQPYFANFEMNILHFAFCVIHPNTNIVINYFPQFFAFLTIFLFVWNRVSQIVTVTCFLLFIAFDLLTDWMRAHQIEIAQNKWQHIELMQQYEKERATWNVQNGKKKKTYKIPRTIICTSIENHVISLNILNKLKVYMHTFNGQTHI